MISFSGIDCAGKTTQIELLKDYLNRNNVSYRVIWSRGGYTSLVEFVKNLIRKDKNLSKEERQSYRENILTNDSNSRLLLLASILDLIRVYAIQFRLIELFGKKIICDRYIWDTYIDFKIKYSKISFERWLSWKVLVALCLKPRVSFMLTIPINESIARSIKKNDPHAEQLEMVARRNEMYLKEINNRRWSIILDGMLDAMKIHQRIKEEISEWIE